MALHYDQILAGNCFGQINVSPPPCSTDIQMIEKKEIQGDLFTQFGFPIEHLFNLARQFLKGTDHLLFTRIFSLCRTTRK